MLSSFEEKILLSRLIPRPKKAVLEDGFFRLENACRVVLEAPGELVPLLQKRFAAYWNVVPEIVRDKENAADEEACRLDISPECLRIECASSLALNHALHTLRQWAEPLPGTARLTGYQLPCGRIEDAPGIRFRGVHFCVFPETNPVDLEKKIRLAAYWKLRYLVLEFWGTFPFESHPELSLEKARLDRGMLARIVKEAAEAGLTLIPQFNVLGHAAGARNRSDKHIILDSRPELAPLFEPEGWSWCLSNPHTRALLRDAVMELHDFFGRPSYFHIGCDEAEDLGHCALCRKRDLRRLVIDHILFFHELFADRNTRIILWHDMLLEQGDERFADFGTRNGLREFSFGTIVDELPKNIVIADWMYGGAPPSEDFEYTTVNYFQDLGFPVLACPWNQGDGIRALARMARRRKIEGLLTTFWHEDSGTKFFSTLFNAAQSTWSEPVPETPAHRLSFTRHLRQVTTDMGLGKDYPRTGSVTWQIPPESITH